MKTNQFFLAKTVVASAIVCFSYPDTFAQVKLGGTASAPAASAILELDGGTNRGLLMPRMNTQNMQSIPAPAEGLVVYTTDDHSLYLRNNGSWLKLNQQTGSFSLPYTGSFNVATPVLSLTNMHATGGAITGISNAPGSTALQGNTSTGTAVAGYASAGIAGYFKATNLLGMALVATGGSIALGTEEKNGFLHIDGSGTQGSTVVVNDADPVIQFNNNGVNTGYLQTANNDIRVGTNVGNETGRFVIRNNGAERFVVSSDGNVGVGAAVTSSKFQVDANSSAATYTMALNDQNSSLLFLNSNANRALIGMDGNNLNIGVTENNTGNLIFKSGAKDLLRIANEGSLIWGTTASNLGKISTAYDHMDIYAGTNDGRMIRLFTAASSEPALIVKGNDGDIKVTNRMLIADDEETTEGRLQINALGDAIENTMVLKDEAPIVQFKNVSGDRGYIRVDENQDMIVATNIGNGGGEVALRTNNQNKLSINSGGYVLIADNTATTNRPNLYKLAVKGGVIAQAFVELNIPNWPDYVFDDSHKLPSLQETEAYIKANKHLPNIPAAAEIEKNGLALGDMQKRMMEKIEELTLHLIEADKRIKKLEQSNELLRQVSGTVKN